MDIYRARCAGKLEPADLGSVSSRVVAEAPCTVTVVRTPSNA
jgi:nucleotide-binding universal stress UspA family protein